MRAFFHSVNTALVTGMVGVAIWAWLRLPDQTPTQLSLPVSGGGHQLPGLPPRSRRPGF
jgi:hypothetical protein